MNQPSIKITNKLFGWLHDKTYVIELTKEESEQLRHCIHAAYYFITEQEADKIPKKFFEFYKHMKKNGAL